MTAAHDEDDGNDSAGQPSAFELLGGEARVRALVDRFYDRMAMDERFEALHALHPKPLDNARDKLFWFLCGWLGGPDRYIERFGHPRLRARHLPYPIASRERDQWLLCMAEAMADIAVPQPLFDRLLEAFSGTADWMRNRAG
jgi:hemoglobin